jgi:hypothetical protein
MAVVLVHAVFRSTGIDYRLVALGALLPWGVDVAFGERSYGSTLALAIVFLLAVMVVTAGRSRLVQRRALCLPIGAFFGLVLSGAWTDSDRFLWPLGGGTIPTDPLVGSWPVLVALEIAGGLAWLWVVLRFDLRDARARHSFLRDGRLA